MNIDERLEAITMNLEILSRDVHDLQETVQELKSAVLIDAENIRGLAGIARTCLDSIKGLQIIAAAHDRRLDDLENRPHS